MGRLSDFLKSPFASLFGKGSSQDRLAAYVIREHHQGRTLEDILDDPYLRNRATETEIRRLIERPDVIRAIGKDTLDSFAGR